MHKILFLLLFIFFPKFGLSESNIDLDKVLSEKRDEDISHEKEYIDTNVSHDGYMMVVVMKFFYIKKMGYKIRFLLNLNL